MRCQVTFGNLQVVAADMVLRPGPHPSACMLTTVAADVPPLAETLRLWNDDTVMAYFPHAAPDLFSLRIVNEHHKGCYWHMRVFDRRWLWQTARISARYNIRTAGGHLVEDDNHLSAREITATLLNGLGETAYYVDDMPDDVYPECLWDMASIPQELDALTARYGCRICLGADNVVRITASQQSVGDGVEDGQAISTNWTYQRNAPTKITVVGAPVVYQDHYWCHPVGRYIDSANDNEVTWSDVRSMPTGRRDNPGIAELPLSWIGMQSPKLQLRAQLEHYHWWRPYCVADGADTLTLGNTGIPDVDVPWDRSDQLQVLPYLVDEHISLHTTVVTDDWRRPAVPYVSYADSMHEYGYNPTAARPDFPRGIERGQDMPVGADTHRNWMHTPVPLAEDKISIVVAHHAYTDDFNGLKRFVYTKELPGGTASWQLVTDESIRLRVHGAWDIAEETSTHSVTHNYDACVDDAEKLIEQHVRQFHIPLRQQRFSGFATMSPNRMIEDVRWFMQYMQPALTHVNYRPLI